MFEIKVGKQAEKFLKNCEKVLFNRIITRLKILRENPVPNDAKRVIGYEKLTFRLRVGNYRALYMVNHEDKRIIVVKIDKRHRVY